MRSVCWLLVLGLLAAPAMAQQEDPAAEPESGAGPGVKELLGLSVMVQGGYQANLDSPASQENAWRVFDHQDNSFVLDLAELQLLHEAKPGGAGFKLKLTAGEDAKWIHSRGLGAPEDFFDLTEAFAETVLPLGEGLRLRFGKFSTFFGAEVLEARDNPNTSRTYLFNYALPVSHTGLMLGYAFGDLLSVNLYLINGWDNTADNNQAKTFALGLASAPWPWLTLLLNVIAGPEQDGNTHDWRLLLDLVAVLKPMQGLAVTVAGAYGRDTVGGEAVAWHGFQLAAKYDPWSWFGVAVRGEFFNDANGFRTGLAQELKGLTATLEFRLPAGFILRPEFRHDWSTQASFNTHTSQDTLGAAVIYSW
jgi:hypothetical protein